MIAVTESKTGVIISVKVQTQAKKNEIKTILDNGVLKIGIIKAAEKNKANKEIIKFMSAIFKLKKEDILIIQGLTSSLKKIEIKGLSKDDVSRRITSFI